MASIKFIGASLKKYPVKKQKFFLQNYRFSKTNNSKFVQDIKKLSKIKLVAI